MKKFIKQILIFIIPLILVFFAFELILREIPNDYKYKNDYLTENSSEINILILGSSHSYYSIKPELIPVNCFNASYISQSIDYDYEILSKFSDKLSNLESIILPVSYFTLFSKLENGVEYWRTKNYSIYYDINLTHSIKDHSEVLSNSGTTNIKRIYSYYIKHQNMVSCSVLGNRVLSNSIDLVETGLIAAKRHTASNFDMYNSNYEILIKIINLAAENGINLFLYTPPAYKTYIENLDCSQLDKTIECATSLSNTYQNVYYINYLTDPRFDDTDFYDADHLNEQGAEKFTEILYYEIKLLN